MATTGDAPVEACCRLRPKPAAFNTRTRGTHGPPRVVADALASAVAHRRMKSFCSRWRSTFWLPAAIHARHERAGTGRLCCRAVRPAAVASCSVVAAATLGQRWRSTPGPRRAGPPDDTAGRQPRPTCGPVPRQPRSRGRHHTTPETGHRREHRDLIQGSASSGYLQGPVRDRHRR